MPKRETMDICADKLRDEIHKRGITLSTMSTELGYSRNLMNDAMKRRRLAPNIIKMLDIMYNIKPEVYVQKIEEPREVGPEKDETTNNELDWQRLHNVIYDAVYSAFKKVMSE